MQPCERSLLRWKAQEAVIIYLPLKFLGNSDNSTFFFASIIAIMALPVSFTDLNSDLNDSVFFCPHPYCFLSDAGHALRLRGAVQEDSWPGVRAAGHDQQLRVREAAAIQKAAPRTPQKQLLWMSPLYISAVVEQPQTLPAHFMIE